MRKKGDQRTRVEETNVGVSKNCLFCLSVNKSSSALRYVLSSSVFWSIWTIFCDISNSRRSNNERKKRFFFVTKNAFETIIFKSFSIEKRIISFHYVRDISQIIVVNAVKSAIVRSFFGLFWGCLFCCIFNVCRRASQCVIEIVALFFGRATISHCSESACECSFEFWCWYAVLTAARNKIQAKMKETRIERFAAILCVAFDDPMKMKCWPWRRQPLR